MMIYDNMTVDIDEHNKRVLVKFTDTLVVISGEHNFKGLEHIQKDFKRVFLIGSWDDSDYISGYWDIDDVPYPDKYDNPIIVCPALIMTKQISRLFWTVMDGAIDWDW